MSKKNPVKEAEEPKNEYSYGWRVKPAILSSRVIRGGNALNGQRQPFPRLAFRNGDLPGIRLGYRGFRLARTKK